MCIDLLQYFFVFYNVKEPHRYKLLTTLYEEPTVVAKGQVWPTIPGATIHGGEIREGYMRVSVDYLEQGLEGVPIPVPTEMSRLLMHVHGSYTLWPKHSIILEQVK